MMTAIAKPRIQLKQLRAEMEQKGTDIMNINDFVRIEMDVEGPLFNGSSLAGNCLRGVGDTS